MVNVNLNKAKEIAHGLRREMRAQEFRPFDQVIAAQIPGADNAAAEAERQVIRDKYVPIQQQIEDATHVDELTAVTQTFDIRY